MYNWSFLNALKLSTFYITFTYVKANVYKYAFNIYFTKRLDVYIERLLVYRWNNKLTKWVTIFNLNSFL